MERLTHLQYLTYLWMEQLSLTPQACAAFTALQFKSPNSDININIASNCKLLQILL